MRIHSPRLALQPQWRPNWLCPRVVTTNRLICRVCECPYPIHVCFIAPHLQIQFKYDLKNCHHRARRSSPLRSCPPPLREPSASLTWSSYARADRVRAAILQLCHKADPDPVYQRTQRSARTSPAESCAREGSYPADLARRNERCYPAKGGLIRR